jgi:DNA-binding CsgD family transcriptional regulator
MSRESTTTMAERLRRTYRWTRRQRAVLDLLAAGKTNQEIANDLSISLAGAKWHVSEILGELGAVDRKEAADYWRRYQGMAPRFGRVFRAMQAPTILRAAGWLSAAAAALVAAAAVVSIRQGDDGTSNPNQPTPSQQPDISMTLEDRQPLPPNTLIYYFGGPIPQEGAPTELRRAYRLASGAVGSENLTERVPLSGQVFSTQVDAATGRIAMAWCVTGYCGSYGWAEPGSVSRLAQSADGGISWSVNEGFPLNSSLVGFSGDQLVVHTLVSPSPDASARVWLFPSGENLIPVTAGLLAGDVVVFDGQVLFRRPDGSLSDTSGRVQRAAPQLPGRPHWVGVDGLASSLESITGDLTRSWVARFDGSTFATRLRSDDFRSEPVAVLTARRILVNARVPALTSEAPHAAVLELDTGKMSILSGLTNGAAEGTLAVGAVVADLAKVNAPGGCLPAREEASTSALALMCLPNDVLVTIAGDTVRIDGTSYIRVTTWSGQSGWVDQAALTR